MQSHRIKPNLYALSLGVHGYRLIGWEQSELRMPLGFLVALVDAERFAVRALRTLLQRLATRPTPEEWRDTVAAALDDDSLRLAFYDPATGRFRETGGGELTRTAAGAGRTWVPVEAGGREMAALVIDETLTEDPELVNAATAATVLAVENGALEGELRASRARILEAGHEERRRIERDLHDSAQQRLVALRIHLSLLGEQLDREQERALLERLGHEVDEAIDELRDVAHGVYPPVLAERGLGDALQTVARRSAVPVSIRAAGLARHSESLETTVYFCCVECLQNAAKHAGPGASVTVDLHDRDGGLSFAVADDGAGFDLDTVERGAGLTNLADRVAAVGGSLRIDTRPGDGTRITGRLPV